MDKKKIKKVVGITACPTGIAHTFMAATGLEREAEKRGIVIKVQKNAQDGFHNKLTAKDIAEADAVIIANSIAVDLSVFDGKLLLQVPVAEPILKAHKVFDKLLGGEGKIHRHEANPEEHASKEQHVTPPKGFKDEVTQIGKKSYHHLLTGFSWIIPFVMAAGILMAIPWFYGDDWGVLSDPLSASYNKTAVAFYTIGTTAFMLLTIIMAGYIANGIGDRPAMVSGMIGGYLAYVGFDNLCSGIVGAIVAGYLAGWTVVFLRKGFSWLPQSLSSYKPIVIFPVGATLLVGAAVIWGVNPALDPLFNPETGWVCVWMNDIPLWAGLLMAIPIGIIITYDFGGVVNKVSYMFAISSITWCSGGLSPIMAMTSVGVMVPPISSWVATTLFYKKFDKAERKLGWAALVLGSSHISEGAIPFAHKRPKLHIPIMMLGSVVAGMLSFALGCATFVPAGGFLILPWVAEWYWWVFSIFAGALVSGVILGIVWKPTFKQIDTKKAVKRKAV